MRNASLVLIAVGIFVAISVLVVAADPPPPGVDQHGESTLAPGQQKTPSAEKGKQLRSVVGIVTAKDTDRFTVTTKQGVTVVVGVLESTRFHIPTQKNATFADLEIQDRVAVNGTPNASGLDAKKVNIAPGKPSVQHRVGTVEEYVPSQSITIKTVQGDLEKFALTNETEIRGKTSPAQGDRVTVVSHRDPSTRVFTASAIVVHP